MTGREEEAKQIFILDFGLARKYIKDGRLVNPRERSKFVGTIRYASLGAHEERELGRSDDIISLFYAMVSIL